MYWSKVLWQRWKVVARKIGDFQARLILGALYFVIIAPFALGLKIFADPLQLKGFGGWQSRSEADEDLLARSLRQS